MTTIAPAEVPLKPTPLPVQPDGIPAAMKAEPRWVAWEYQWRATNGKPGKWTKEPRIATATGRGASSTDRATWRSFSDAISAFEDGKCDGIGFVLGDGWVGFDADGTHAPDLINLLNTYSERSPSGEGVHAIARGSKPGPKCRTGRFELYEEGRYFTVTGHAVEGMPTTVEERTVQISELYRRLFADEDDAASVRPDSPLGGDDASLIAGAKAAKNGKKFSALWSGDISGYPSHSEADMALCAMLAFRTNGNSEQIDRLFRRSALMRSKWDERRGRSTYGADVVAKAVAGTPAREEQNSALTIWRASDVPDETLEKQFGGRLVRGSFGLLSGPGEGGKGMFIVDTSARFTTGDPFPGEKARRPPTNVVVCVTEDSMGRVKSRLRAAGADLERVFFVAGPAVTRGGLTMPSPMMLDDDAGKLVRYAKQIDARVLALETVVEHFGDRGGKSRRSTNNEADVRSALSPFRAVCAMAGLYGLGAIHPRKSTDGTVDDSISGSAAFRNVTRSAHHIYRDPEDETEDPVRLLFTSKANYLSRRPPTLRFQIRSWDEHFGMPCACSSADCGHEGRVVWESELIDDRTAEEVWQQIAERSKPRRDVAVQEAEEFLKGLMQEGRINLLPEAIFAMAAAEQITKAALRRAKEKLRLVSKKAGFPAVVVGWEVELR